MNKHKIERVIKRFLYAFGAFVLCYLLLYCIDRAYGRYHIRKAPDVYVTISQGDIIYKVTSYIMADSKYPHFGSLPGHLGIFLSDTIISVHDNGFERILVAESSLFNIKDKIIVPTLRVNSADHNYRYAIGRLILIKTHLNDYQKEKLRQYVELNNGKPYELLAKKNDAISFNCATFVWNAFNYAVNIDVDANGGKIVLPADILNYFIEKGDCEIIKF